MGLFDKFFTDTEAIFRERTVIELEEEFHIELANSSVKFDVDEIFFSDASLKDTPVEYVEALCDKNPSPFYVFHKTELTEDQRELLILKIDETERYVGVNFPKFLLVARKGIWARMQAGQPLY